jgi:hypothetical protein
MDGWDAAVDAVILTMVTTTTTTSMAAGVAVGFGKLREWVRPLQAATMIT